MPSNVVETIEITIPVDEKISEREFRKCLHNTMDDALDEDAREIAPNAPWQRTARL